MGKRLLNRPFTKRGCPNGQYIYEKMLNFISSQGHANESDNAGHFITYLMY